MKETQKMCFVGRKNVNYMISGTTISGDLIAVAFLIWDSILWALETQQDLPASRAAHAELWSGTQEMNDHPVKYSQMFYSCTVASKNCL